MDNIKILKLNLQNSSKIILQKDQCGNKSCGCRGVCLEQTRSRWGPSISSDLWKAVPSLSCAAMQTPGRHRDPRGLGPVPQVHPCTYCAPGNVSNVVKGAWPWGPEHRVGDKGSNSSFQRPWGHSRATDRRVPRAAAQAGSEPGAESRWPSRRATV